MTKLTFAYRVQRYLGGVLGVVRCTALFAVASVGFVLCIVAVVSNSFSFYVFHQLQVTVVYYYSSSSSNMLKQK